MMEKGSIANLLNPDGYCVPELKDFFKKREPVQQKKSDNKDKFGLQKGVSGGKLRTSRDSVSANLKPDILDSALEMEDNESDCEDEVEQPTRKRTRRRKKKLLIDKEKESRTVFVGNLPNSWNKMKIKRYFSKYGEVETLRLRCAPLADPRVPKKVAVIKKNFHPDRTSIHGFVRFVDKDSATNALQANGTQLGGHHVRVDLALNDVSRTHDKRKAIFIGNVPFSAEEDDLWTLFENCGDIDSIRVLRDSRTGVGKGFAYVNFKTSDAVELALKMNGEQLKDRSLRICRYAIVKKKKSKDKKNKVRHRIRKDNSTKSSKGSQKNDDSKTANSDKNLEENKMLLKKKHLSAAKEANFQGQTVSDLKKLKKKKKISKAEQKKKILIAKLSGGLSKKK